MQSIETSMIEYRREQSSLRGGYQQNKLSVPLLCTLDVKLALESLAVSGIIFVSKFKILFIVIPRLPICIACFFRRVVIKASSVRFGVL